MAEKREDIERSIYIHVCRNLDAGSQSNAWYVINQRPEGAEICPVFDDIPQLYPGGALADTNCEVVDSNLYVIGGWDSVKHTYTNVVRCLDTRNPSNGWKTCLTLPFACCGALSTVCGEWMYVIGGDYQGYPIRSSRLPWGLVFNLDCKLEKLYTLRAPGVDEFPDASAAFLGGLLVFIPNENALYIHNPVHRKWEVYKSNDVIVEDEDDWDFCVVSGGILYSYNMEDGKLFAYDLIQRQRLTPIKVPDSLKIPDDCIPGGTPSLVSVANSKLCFIWDEESSSRLMIRADHPSPDGSSEVPQKKKAKSSDQPTKKIKMDDSTQRGGGASSGKPKGAVTKSGHKTKEDRKVDGKSKDGSKSDSKSENDNVTKAKGHTPQNGSKSGDIALKVCNKSKNEDSGETPKSIKSKGDGIFTPKASTKSKQDTSRAAKSKQETSKISSNSKGKSLKSGGNSNSNGSGKSKSGSPKVEGK
ncbi:hypothetical protein SCA6_000704 [Theobroma cacao]